MHTSAEPTPQRHRVAGPARRPVLSFVLCSRNDAYLGNSRWRLETALNYLAAQVHALGCTDQVEVVVADWNSDQPLAEAVALDPVAARFTRFVLVPPALAARLQLDSPFAEVIAINAAARRARGAYIGRIDQDTLVGRRFLRRFLHWAERGSPVEAPLDRALWFSNRRSIPYRFAVRCPSFARVRRLVGWFGRALRVETAPVFYRSDVGIWLMHRDLWDEAGGYDERMIYMNDMEIDMAGRLMTRYPMVDLGALVGWDFYHLDHYHPRGSRSSSTHRRVNATRSRPDLGLRPSGPRWGLAGEALEERPAVWCRSVIRRRPVLDVPVFLLSALVLALRVVADGLVYRRWPLWRQKWTRRARRAWQTVAGQPVWQWPGLLRRLWTAREKVRP